MLVIISDLHLSDGTSGETISPGAFRVFRARLSDMAYDASWRANGKYKPVEKLDLILLGDIFDLIRSTKWVIDEAGNPCEVRPWDDYTSQTFINKIRAINTAVLQHNANSTAVLRSISQERSITIPPATTEGQVAKVSRDPQDPNRVPVKINIHYMVGNHDWFYHLPGPAYDQIRQEVVEALGLAHSPLKPFPCDLAELPDLEAVCAMHEVYARHGDIYDSDNFDGDRNASSLGDAVVVELLNRFPAEVEQRMGDELPQACIDGLKELDNVRPMLVIPIWIDSVLNRTCQDRQQIQGVKDIWDELADVFLSLPFVRLHDEPFKFFDRVDTLELALKFSRKLSLRLASQIVTWFQRKSTGNVGTYHQTAFSEPAFINKTAKYIVHGHTHLREIVPLDASNVGGQRFEQIYFNSGTWRRVHELAQFNPKKEEFLGYHEMTYFAFYRNGERKGRPFEVWSGTLGIS